jgi:hypothetical protein
MPGAPALPDGEVPGSVRVTVSTTTEAGPSEDTGIGTLGVGLTAGVGMPAPGAPGAPAPPGPVDPCGRVTVTIEPGPPVELGRVTVTTGPVGFAGLAGTAVVVTPGPEPTPGLPGSPGMVTVITEAGPPADPSRVTVTTDPAGFSEATGTPGVAAGPGGDPEAPE